MKQTLHNRKASFNYNIEEKYSSGIILTGDEVKSIKDNGLSFNDSYCIFVGNELWLKGLHIPENKFGQKQSPTRDRKLLLKKRELKKLEEKIKEKGYSIVPTKMFFNENGNIKFEIGIGKGKKEYDKRETIKKRDIEREIKSSY